MWKFVIEDWLTEEIIKIFDTEEQRNDWITENCISFSDGCYIDNTNISIPSVKIGCYEMFI